MPNQFLITSNDTENGYIYKEFNARLMNFEKELRSLHNLLSGSESSVSPLQLSEMLLEIEKRAKLEYVKNHIEDNQRHVSGAKLIEWDAKYRSPIDGIPEEDLSPSVQQKLNTIAGTSLNRKEFTIGNKSDTSFTINHNLNTRGLFVSIWDKDYKQVYTNVHSVNMDIIKVEFLQPPDINEYRVVVIG